MFISIIYIIDVVRSSSKVINETSYDNNFQDSTKSVSNKMEVTSNSSASSSNVHKSSDVMTGKLR